jgi:hypothetical protein
MNLPPEFKKTYPDIHQYVRDLETENKALHEEITLLKDKDETNQRRIRILEKQRPPNSQLIPNSQVCSPVDRIDLRKPKF